MNGNILIGIGILFGGIMISRLIQGFQLRRLESAQRVALSQHTRAVRAVALIPALVATILFIIGIITLPDIAAQLTRLMIWCGAGYAVLLNIWVIIAYMRAKCSLLSIVLTLLAKAILFSVVAAFCYFVIIGV